MSTGHTLTVNLRYEPAPAQHYWWGSAPQDHCRRAITLVQKGLFDTIVTSEEERRKVAFIKNDVSLINRSAVVRDFIRHNPLCVVLPDDYCDESPSGGGVRAMNTWKVVGKTDSYASRALGKRRIGELQSRTGKTEVKVLVIADGLMKRLAFVGKKDGCCSDCTIL